MRSITSTRSADSVVPLLPALSTSSCETTRFDFIVPSQSCWVKFYSGRGVRRLLAVDHPRRAELIHEHAKTLGPEGFLDRHPHRSFFRQRMKYALRLLGVVDTNRHRESLHRLVAIRRSVGAHQDLVPHAEAGREDFLTPLTRHLV